MILSVSIVDKNFGDKTLYKNLKFDIQAGEKVGLIGRNGTGKTTLLNIISGEDKDYAGEVTIKNRSVIISTRQEHHGHEDKTVLEYIQGDLPEYSKLIKIIDEFSKSNSSNPKKMQEFSDALERFNQLGYFQIEDEIGQLFTIYQIDLSKMHQPIKSLSGGQKRMIELIKVIRSRGHLALIDEPTNHMDYVAKGSFTKWLSGADEAVLVITHDRDVLSAVDRILEIKDGRCFSHRGNYEAFLKNNTSQVTNLVNEYELTQKRIANLEDDVIRFRRFKEKARDPGTIHRFKSQEIRAQSELNELRNVEKPSFWIDQESANTMNDKLSAVYEKHKAKNIKLSTKSKDDLNIGRKLIQVNDLSLGYETPLFNHLGFILNEGDRLRLHGRNGAGKSTIVNAIMSTAHERSISSKVFDGFIDIEKAVKIGLYEQEIHQKYLPLTLNQAIEQIMREKDVAVSDQKIKQILSDYLFNPITDGQMIVERLSGGQKARIQLISMLIDNPQILILDEPTNHLDLPSIEELENSLKSYNGAIIYISHDSYFARNIGGETILIKPADK